MDTDVGKPKAGILLDSVNFIAASSLHIYKRNPGQELAEQSQQAAGCNSKCREAKILTFGSVTVGN